MSAAVLSDLWSAALERLSWLRGLFGTPFAFLARREPLTREEHRAILAYLRPLEWMVRCALVLLALTPLDAPAPRHKRRAGGTRSAPAPAWPGPESERWTGVHFRVLPRAATRRARARKGIRADAFDRYSLAKRMEAVARVMADPERWARRLAKMFRERMEHARDGCRRLMGSPIREPSCDAAVCAISVAVADTS